MKIITLLVFIIIPFLSFSQTFNLKNYNVNDDLPQAYIYTINQSPKGKLWIGTGEGLSTFDGDRFTNYTTANGLSENFITSSLIDKEGNQWFGHYEGGITFFNGNNFKKINTNKFIHGPVNAMVQDSSGMLWLATQNDGLITVSNQHLLKTSAIKANASINDLAFIRQNRLLLGTASGLLFLDLKNNKGRISKILLPDIVITDVAEDKAKNSFWIATQDKGIYRYDIYSDSLLPVAADVSLQGENINLVYKDLNEHLWVSIYGKGIVKFAILNDSILQTGRYNTTTGLSNNYVKSLFTDRENNFWIGTYGGGLDQLIDPVFTLYTTNDKLPSNNVTALYMQNNILWAGTNKGIVKLTFSLLEKNNLQEERAVITKNLPTSPITTLHSLDEQTLLIGTNTDGVYKYQHQNGILEKWHYSLTDHLENKINQIAIDKFNNIWIATENGVHLYSKEGIKQKVFNMETGLLHNNVHSIFVDKNNTIWFGMHGSGLSCYKQGAIFNFKSPQQGAGIDINCFEEDEQGNLWIGTYGQGIYIFSGENFIRRYTQKNGLGSNYCYQIVKDEKNNFWIGHKNGITKYDIKKKDFYFYQKKHGFLAEETNTNAALKDFNGNLWFGTTTGLLRYNPAADKPNVVGPLVNLYDIRLFFQKVNWKKYSDSLFSLYHLPAHLVLPYNQNHLTFGVKGISLTDPEKVKYKYKLEGFEKDWSLETNENFVTYANMPPGKYSFLAISKNSKGIWSSEAASFNFEILNPFWKTWWFILLSIILFFFLLYVSVRTRTKSLIRRQIQLQEEKERLLAEIREREKAQQLQKVTEEKLRQTNQELNTFIYRASHDLRGPLSTVKGLTNLGIMEITDEAALRYFNLISDRIIRLDTILKDLIHIVEITEIEFDIQLIDFSEALASVLESLSRTYVDREYDIRKNVSINSCFYNDLKLIQIILLNVIDNSMKYIHPENRNSLIEINIADTQEGIVIRIKDNGMGIPADVQTRIFDMFFRGTDQSKGSGLGLYLVNKIVNKLNGNIKVESMYMKGTKIEIFIPSLKKPEENTSKVAVHPSIFI